MALGSSGVGSYLGHEEEAGSQGTGVLITGRITQCFDRRLVASFEPFLFGFHASYYDVSVCRHIEGLHCVTGLN